ncbi:MAG: hypothetical protein RIQ93_3087 [Verrucomicrobiota bacterium]|jgi:FkbM family methyltransferase
MTLKSRLRRAGNRLLAPIGVKLVRTGETAPAPARWSMATALARAAAHGIAPQTVIDVGAAEGRWTREARAVFPDAAYLLVEPLQERAAKLDLLARMIPRAVFAPVAAGASTGSVAFFASADLDGSGVYSLPSDVPQRRVPMERLDDLVHRHHLPGPYVVKLDTHGFEAPILEGCAGILPHIELLVIEAYVFKLSDHALKFWELCAWLETRGFRPMDMADPFPRKHDGAWWQFDLFFMRSEQALFGHPHYA